MRFFNKLHLYVREGSILQWIEAFLTNHQQQVLCDGGKSQCTSVTFGVPQGTMLGPLLFPLHVYDIPHAHNRPRNHGAPIR